MIQAADTAYAEPLRSRGGVSRLPPADGLPLLLLHPGWLVFFAWSKWLSFNDL